MFTALQNVTYIFFKPTHLNCHKLSKGANELEMNKKKSLEVWENKSRKGDIDTRRTQGMRHEGYVRHKST